MAHTQIIAGGRHRVCPVAIENVTLRDGFWKEKADKNRGHALKRLYEHLASHGVVDNFMRVSGRKDVERRGALFTDSDLYKWIEGAAATLAGNDDSELDALCDEVIDEIAAAQDEDGYINTFYQKDRPEYRYTDLKNAHELYCAGHLFQAAVVHRRATGKDNLLDVACRFADHLCETFGDGKREGRAGHPEIEMALVELYRETEKRDYLELAGYLLDQYDFSNMDRLSGHAVRALYLACGGADYAVETGDKSFEKASVRLWEDLVFGRTYITGAVGSRHRDEAIGDMYELPNERAYAETCASIANVMWNARMLAAYGSARYADAMETALYNGVLAGVSYDGGSYFYENPLACYGPYQRQEWFGCTCCPTNMVRTLAQLPGYMYGTSEEGVWVHLFDSSSVKFEAGGKDVVLKTETDYPHGSEVSFEIGMQGTAEFSVFLRIPAWSEESYIEVNSRTLKCAPGEYYELRKKWRDGDSFTLFLDTDARFMECDPRVRENMGMVCVMRGPLVYCAESVDNPECDIRDTEIICDELTSEYDEGLFGGIVTVGAVGCARPEDSAKDVYRTYGSFPRKCDRTFALRLVPYHLWANRGESEMTVWMPSNSI